MAERFYVNWFLEPGPVYLEGPEAHHLANVRRLRRGDRVVLFNGDGREYPAEIQDVSKKQVSLEILESQQPPRELEFRLEVAASLPKGDRADFLIEKLTELGVTSFTPLQTRRSVVHPRETKLDRLQRQVIEASKQCGRNVLMEINPLIQWHEYIGLPTLPRRRLLAHVGESKQVTNEKLGDVGLAIGPEGGFTDEEVEQGRDAGWDLIGLGPRILRVETAALVLAAAFTY